MPAVGVGSSRERPANAESDAHERACAESRDEHAKPRQTVGRWLLRSLYCTALLTDNGHRVYVSELHRHAAAAVQASAVSSSMV